MSVIQYPHIAKVYEPSASIKDSDGNWQESSLTLKFETRCRIEPNSGNQYIIGAGGNQITFKSIVYMPVPLRVVTLTTATASQVVFAGKTELFIVPAELNGLDEANVPAVSGKTFTVTMDGRPLKEDEEFVITATGFKLIGMTFITDQRFELGVYFTFSVSNIQGSGVSSSSDFYLQPGLLFEVWEGERKIVNETIKQFSKGQLNARVWL